MDNIRANVYADFLEGCIEETKRAAATVPEGARMRQLAEAKAHPLWLIGHLANTLHTVVYIWIFEQDPIFDKTFAKMYAPDFARGNPITGDPGAYYSWGETLDRYAAIGGEVVEQVRAMPDDRLPSEPGPKMPAPFKQHFPTNELTLAQMIRHDSHHRGQMSMIAALPV